MSSQDRGRPPGTTTAFKPLTDWIPAANLHRWTVSMEFSDPSPRVVFRVACQAAVPSPQSNADWSPPEWFDPGDQDTDDDSQ